MDIALNGRFFANHNKKSIGQNRYHVVNYKPDENNNIGLVYTELMKKRNTKFEIELLKKFTSIFIKLNENKV